MFPVILQVESHGHQVCEELYELYGALVSQPQSTQHTDCYKSYLIVSHVCKMMHSYTYVYMNGYG